MLRAAIVDALNLSILSETIKEDVFEWIVHLSQFEFDQLCSEIIALDNFFEKYEGQFIVKREELQYQFRFCLPVVELRVELGDQHYNKHCFYRWLEIADTILLQSIILTLQESIRLVESYMDAFVVPEAYLKMITEGNCYKIGIRNHVLNSCSEEIKTWRMVSEGDPLGRVTIISH